MELFDKKYVHFMWSDELNGKNCFCSDRINSLISYVNENEQCKCSVVEESESPEYPFHSSGSTFKFAYYDPNYDCKIAYARGEKIQVYDCTKWLDCSGEPNFFDDCMYRIKPKESNDRRMTYRELAEWLARSKGQYRISAVISIDFEYCEHYDSAEVDEGVMIRHWGSEDWIVPTYDVYMKDCKGE